MGRTYVYDAVTVATATMACMPNIDDIMAAVATIIAIMCGIKSIVFTVIDISRAIIARIKAKEFTEAIDIVKDNIESIDEALGGDNIDT